MKIAVYQVESEQKNKFEIKYDNIIKYKAVLPFVTIKEPLDLEKIRNINIYNLNNEKVYTTDYAYLENLKEQFIPFKFLFTGSQKFNQLLFKSETNTIKIYYEENDIWKNRYVIEVNDKRYYCYSVEDGHIRHLPIFDDEKQIGEILKSNIVIDAKDEYCCYLKDKYKNIADGIVALILYLDRKEYSSSYIVNNSYTLKKKYSYNRNNKYYDKDWVKNNFDEEFYKKVEKEIEMVKEKLKHPIKTNKELYNSLDKKQKKMMNLLLIIPWATIVIVALIILFFIIINSLERKTGLNNDYKVQETSNNTQIVNILQYIKGNYFKTDSDNKKNIYYFSSNGNFAYLKDRECISKENEVLSYYGTWKVDNNNLILNIFGEELATEGELTPDNNSCLQNYNIKQNTDIKNKTITYKNIEIKNDNQYLILSNDDKLYKLDDIKEDYYNDVKYLAEDNSFDDRYYEQSKPLVYKYKNINGNRINEDNNNYFEFDSSNCNSSISFSISLSNKSLLLKKLNNNESLYLNKIKNVKQIVRRNSSVSCEGFFYVVITEDGGLYYNKPFSYTNTQSLQEISNKFYKLNTDIKFKEITGIFNYGCEKKYCGIPLNYTILKTDNDEEVLFYPDSNNTKIIEFETII